MGDLKVLCKDAKNEQVLKLCVINAITLGDTLPNIHVAINAFEYLTKTWIEIHKALDMGKIPEPETGMKIIEQIRAALSDIQQTVVVMHSDLGMLYTTINMNYPDQPKPHRFDPSKN